MDKRGLRNQIRQIKNSYSAEELKEKSSRVIEHLRNDQLFNKAHVICLYSSLPDEVDTHWLIDTYAKSKKILLPSVEGEDIELHEYNFGDSLHKGIFGIGESNGKVFNDYANIDLVIVPGMAFDLDGNRLGRGKGYYDRFLSQVQATKIGICFDFQLLKKIPSLHHDVRMDVIISEGGRMAIPS